MAIATTTSVNVTAACGGLAHDLDRLMLRIQSQKAWLDTLLDSDLIAMGYVQADVNTLRSAMLDLDKLRQVYQGAAISDPAYDFRTFAKQLYLFGSLV